MALLGVACLIFAFCCHPPLALALILLGTLIYFVGFWTALAIVVGGFALLVLVIAKQQGANDWPRQW